MTVSARNVCGVRCKECDGRRKDGVTIASKKNTGFQYMNFSEEDER